jgi:hypothetical protein
MMSLRATTTFLIFVLFSFTVLYGCATGHTRVWVDEKVSFTDYQVFEILPVFDATGETLSDRVPVTITSLLKEQFTDKGFPITDSSQINDGVLIVRSNIVVYEGCRINKLGTAATGLSPPGTGSSGTTMAKSTCILRTQLVDKSINRVVAEIYTTKVVGGCFTDNYKDQWLLKEVATDVVQEVGRIIASKGPA